MAAHGLSGEAVTATQPTAEPDARFRAPADATALDVQALGRYLAAHGFALDTTRPPQQFAAGLANINYLLDVNGEPMVLRRPPDGPLPPGAHDMKREHRILSRLWRSLPLAPRSYLLCEDRSVLGIPFQLIEYRDGRVIVGDDASAFEGAPQRAAVLADRLVDTLVAVHQVDCEQVGLAELGRPDGFIARAIEGWRNRGERLDLASRDARALAQVGNWLARQRIATRPAVLLHCDFKLDNLILDPATLAPRAIVDWDMGTRGDPLFDLATLTSYWTEASDPPCMHRLAQMPSAALGFPTRSEVVERYARLTDTTVDDFNVFRVLAMFKLSVVFFQLHALFVAGRRSDARYASFDQLAGELLEFTLDATHAAKR